MKSIFCLFYFLIFAMQLCMAQSSKFDSVVNQIYFNILTVNADSAIQDYLKMNVPIYAKKDNEPKWRLSNIYIDPTLIQYTLDTFTFSSHPYLHERFDAGNFNFLIKKYQGRFVGVSDMYLCFEYKLKSDAEKVYKKLIKSLAIKDVYQEDGFIDGPKATRLFDNSKSGSLFHPVLVMLKEGANERNNFEVIFGVEYMMKNFRFKKDFTRE